MEKDTTGLFVVAVILFVVSPCVSLAETCYYKPEQEPIVSRGFDVSVKDLACWKDFKKMAVSLYNFEKDYWDDGMGWNKASQDKVCATEKPFHRMMRAIVELMWSSPNWRKPMKGEGGKMLDWAWYYAAKQLDNVRAGCYDEKGASGLTFVIPHINAGIIEWTQFYWPFFYDSSNPERASMILHEAAHAAGHLHDGGTRCDAGHTCDQELDGESVNAAQAVWLCHYTTRPGQYSNPALQKLASQKANTIYEKRFVEEHDVRCPKQ